ncbi:hypothetical protein ACPBEH_03410 [Latilactobacillus sp. 5-91]|uniref:hypothetical protein n=1 Tax=Latilactobacillus TaxID=2767885 RepID=UPI000B9D6A7A|nr:hypothetical protein [Latilactobacillus sakei]BAX68606.1 hypothetical protein LASAK_01198 [Latilactobacillus sakei]
MTTKTIPAVSYVVQVNQLLERFVVFETVFFECTQTCRNIILGRCTVGETLATLDHYVDQNLTVLRAFVTQVAAVQPPTAFVTINQQLITALEHYVDATETMVHSFEGPSKEVYAQVLAARHDQEAQREEINTVLHAISKVSFSTADMA